MCVCVCVCVCVYTPIQNFTTPKDEQKYGRKRLGRRYGAIPLQSRY